MNSPIHNMASSTRAYAGEAEATLRLIASLPAPEGIEDRVEAALRAAPRQRRSVLNWPALPGPSERWMQSALLRGAAAAAIVFIVAGGGWSVYSRVQPAQSSNAIPIPHAAVAGGFSNAGAMRTPQTVTGPVLSNRGIKTAKQAGMAAKSKSPGSEKRLKAEESKQR